MRVYLNGNWVPAEAASVSAFDRGFVFGDGVYEVVPIYGERPFRAAAHIQRLTASLAAVRITVPHGMGDWPALLDALAQTLPAGAGDGSIYLQVTRGAAPRQHSFPRNAPATVFGYARPHMPVPPADIAGGIRAVLLDDIRWRRCDIKSISLLANVLLVQAAVEQGAAEALLVRDGRVYEGAVSNVFAVCAGTLVTAPCGPLILNGITRDVILELAHGAGVPIRDEALTRAELLAADEVMITSSTREIVAVTRIGDHKIGSGHPGPVFRALYNAFQSFKDAVRRQEAS
ncbi:MAG: aminotransferase class IV [Acidiferrobacter sp.]